MSFVHQPSEILQRKYRITGVLGKGGVAVTYSAVNLETDLPIAIKVISLKQLDNWKQVELFQREAEVLKKLKHPAIPNYIDYFDIETETDKAFYLVQQLAPGKSLLQLIESGWRANEKEVKNIARQVLEILKYLHSLDPPVIHRDLKPGNIIRDDDGKIYLVDFGAVQNTYYNTLMQGSTVVGTYGYMSPEQFQGRALPATDLYSLGATLLYLLTHRSPAELPQDTLKLDFRNSVDISESFADWLDKILEPDVEDRFSNANFALAELLEKNKKKQGKFITSVTALVLATGLIIGFNSYKWFFLSRLGYTPSNICSNINKIENYINQGGKINIIVGTKLRYRKNPILNCIIKLYSPQSHEKEQLVKLLIKNGADVNFKDEKGNSPLLLAAESNKNVNIIKILLENGANPNIENNQNETPILITEDGNITKLLIEYGADVNTKNKRDNPVLFLAINRNNTEIAKLLIKNGADVNTKDRRGYTVLSQAVYEENLEIVKLLIEHGADVSNDFKALYQAASGGNIEIFELLLKHGANAKAKKKNDDSTILFPAVSGGNIEIVKLLLEHGANARFKNKYDESPLAHVKTKEIAELLIEHGADINAQKRIKRTSDFSSTFPSNSHFRGQIEYQGTPLSNAVSRENVDIVKLLLEHGAEVNYAPLFKAVHKENIQIVELLIEYGADINSNNREKQNILFYAYNKKIAELLIDKGANIHLKDNSGNTSLFYIRDLETIQLLIDKGIDVNARNHIGSTAIFNYASFDQILPSSDKLQLLIDNGADINVKDNNGNTPLFSYIAKYSYSHENQIQLLIDNGADINLKNLSGQTPLSTAIYKRKKNQVQLLIGNGADISYLDADKIRSVHRMNDTKYAAIVDFLQENKFNTHKK